MYHKELKKPSLIALILAISLEVAAAALFNLGYAFGIGAGLVGLAILYLGLGMVVADGLLKPKGKEESTPK